MGDVNKFRPKIPFNNTIDSLGEFYATLASIIRLYEIFRYRITSK